MPRKKSKTTPGPRRRRPGAGRPSLGALARSEVVKVYLTPAEKAAVVAVVKAENAAVNDGTTATPATWFRDLGLDRLGLLGPDDEDNNNAVGQALDAEATEATDHDAAAAETTDADYRIIEAGHDCGPVRSWTAILEAIDDADLGDGAPSVWSAGDQRFLRRDEVAARAALER
jgi:hypothetical protein